MRGSILLFPVASALGAVAAFLLGGSTLEVLVCAFVVVPIAVVFLLSLR